MTLSAWRKTRALSQASLAEALGLRSKAQISGIETGAVTPTAELAIRIERLTLGAVSVAQLRPDLKDVRVVRSDDAGAAA